MQPHPPKLAFCHWDSVHFGLRIGRVLPTTLDAELSKEALDWANESSLNCLYLLLDSRDATGIRLANESGYRIVDVRVTLSAKLANLGEIPGAVREANTNDLPYLRELAKRSHRSSRFYADGNFSEIACDELFATWIERSVREREFAGVVFVPLLEGDRPGGYITCAVKNGMGEIGLIAVDKTASRSGLGTALLATSAKWFREQGLEHVSVVTQGSNIPALRMYERFGFRIESTQLWFHWWRKR